MESLPIFSTAYLPPIDYFAVLAKKQEVLIEQYETFPKQTYRNRTVILTANGPLPLVVPVIRPYGNHTYTHNISISYTERWNINHWRAITSAYSASPYFLYYKDPLEAILMQRHEQLIDLNNALLQQLLKSLKISTITHYTTDYAPEGSITEDFRNTFSPKKERNINVPTYNQVFESKMPFVPNMSILDLLFNLGPEAKSYLDSLG